MLYVAGYSSPLGELALAGTEQALTGLWLPGQRYFGAGLPEQVERWETLPAFDAARRWLDRYFAGERPDEGSLVLAPVGTAFQRRIWSLLREIPWGTTATYGELARRVGSSPRAVGGAVGHNPISILIPCHRVVGADGSLTGYAGGIERKRWLLDWERSN